MRRREFIAAVGSASAWPLVAPGQADRVYRLGVLTGAPRNTPRMDAFFDELRVFGFTEGQNLKVDPGRFALRNDQIPDAAVAMATYPPDVVFCAGDLAAQTAQKAMPMVPIVGLFNFESGLVRSLAHPEGNLTGVNPQTSELNGKRQDILLEAVPGVHHMAAVADPSVQHPLSFRHFRMPPVPVGSSLRSLLLTRPRKLRRRWATPASGAAAINMLAAPLFSFSRRVVIDRATAIPLPAIYEWPDMEEEGGLIGYGALFPVIYRQGARQIVKILRGVKPADVPVEQPTNFELVVNRPQRRLVTRFQLGSCRAPTKSSSKLTHPARR